MTRPVSTVFNQGRRRVRSPAKDCLPSRHSVDGFTTSGFVAEIELIEAVHLPYRIHMICGAQYSSMRLFGGSSKKETDLLRGDGKADNNLSV